MWHPLAHDASEVMLAERDQTVQALPPQRAEQPLAERIRLGTLRRGFQDLHPQVVYTPVQFLGEDRLAVMNQEPVRVIRWDYLA